MNIKSILLPVLLALAPAARATLYYHIDGESGSVLTTGSTGYTATGSVTAAGYTQNYSLPTYTLTQTNNTNCVEQNTVSKFGFVMNPDGDYDAPLVISGTDTMITPFRGSGYLQFSYPAFRHPDGSGRSSPPGNKNAQNLSLDAADKVMVVFAHNKDNFNQPNWNPDAVQKRDIGRYMGFALYIPTVDTMPVDNSRWTILYQAFQLGTGGRPPFAITITKARTGQPAPQQADTVEISFGFRDNDDTDTPEGNMQQTSGDDIQSTTCFRTAQLKRGVWYSLVIWQKPSSDPDIGEAKAWLAEGGLPPSANPMRDKYLVLDFAGKWGYPNPQKPGGPVNPDRDSFSGQLGLYSNDVTYNPARVLFDEIKFADTYDEANPAAVPASQKPVVSAFDGGESSPNIVVAGQTVQITGSNFAAPAEVWFDDTQAATVIVNSPQSITAVVPASLAVTGQLSVHCSGWVADATQAYRLASAPMSLLKLESQTINTGHGISIVAAAESDIAVTFRWEYSQDNGQTWINAIGSNYIISDGGRILSIMNTSATLNGYKYRYVAASAAGEATSNIMILTVAPAILDAPAALAVNNTDGALYVTDTAHHAIYKITGAATASLLAGAPGSAGMADASGSAAKFNTPSGVAINTVSNLLLVADTGNHRIRTVTATGSVGTLAGGGAAGMADGAGAQAAFNQPAAVAVDSAGNAYVADSLNHTIRKITPSGEVSTLAGAPGVSGTLNGAGADARFNTPSGIAVDAVNYVYVADTGNHAIRLITPARAVSTLAGGPGVAGADDGAVASARFNAPTGLLVDANGAVFVADTGNSLIREIDSGAVSTLAGSPDSAHAPAGASHQDGPGAAAWFDHPTGIALNADGSLLYIADRGNATIRTIDETDTVRTLVLTAGSPITPPASGTNNNNNDGTGGGSGTGGGGGGSSSGNSNSSNDGGGGGGGGGAPGLYFLAALAALATLRRFQ
jgi:sugar lactone lactonase YvrE